MSFFIPLHNGILGKNIVYKNVALKIINKPNGQYIGIESTRTFVKEQNDFLENFHKVHIIIAKLLDSQDESEFRLRGYAECSKKRCVALKNH